MGTKLDILTQRDVRTEAVRVARHENLTGEYWILTLEAPATGAAAKPGQFIHLEIPTAEDAILRRPFSIYLADEASVSILYKPVGRGTRAMLRLRPGDTTSIIGPLGNGFPVHRGTTNPVLVAGGYGMAALFMVARALPNRGVIFMGGASARDILCVDDFKGIGWDVQITTVDGTRGTQGLVTDLIDPFLDAARAAGREPPEYFACGPNGMLRAVAERAQTAGHTAWLSMDRHMGCGVGACLVCVQRVRDPAGAQGWGWARVCTEGPVFEAGEVVWDDEA